MPKERAINRGPNCKCFCKEIHEEESLEVGIGIAVVDKIGR